MTPGKVVHETPLYQLIQYTPTTEKVLETPLVIFPPWINRFYILDLNPEKSFVQWAVEQGLTVFMVSLEIGRREPRRRGARTIMSRAPDRGDRHDPRRLGVEAVHAIGYCVAGTTLAATLALLAGARRGRQGRERRPSSPPRSISQKPATSSCSSATSRWRLLAQLTADKGYLDGRYMAATFNLLRGRDLIWSYVVNNYLLGEESIRRSTCCTGTATPPTCRRTGTAPIWRRSTATTSWSSRAGFQRRRHADRPQHGQDAELCPGRPRRSYRAARKRLEDHRPFQGPTSASCSPARGISPAWSTRPRRANINIGPTTREPASLEDSSPARPSTRAAGGPTGSSWLEGPRAQDGRGDRRAGARQGQEESDRGRPGTLRPRALGGWTSRNSAGLARGAVGARGIATAGIFGARD